MIVRQAGEGGGGLAKEWIGAHISGVEGLDSVLVTEPSRIGSAGGIEIISTTTGASALNLMNDAREFDLCDPFFFPKHPLLPLGRAIGHASQYDPRHLQPGLA